MERGNLFASSYPDSGLNSSLCRIIPRCPKIIHVQIFRFNMINNFGYFVYKKKVALADMAASVELALFKDAQLCSANMYYLSLASSSYQVVNS